MKFLKKIVIIVLCFVFMFDLKAENATSHPEVAYDGFNIVEPNHAKLNISLKKISRSDITITGSDANKIFFGNWKNGQPGAVASNIHPSIQAIYYHGKLNFGTTTSAKTQLDAEIAIRFNSSALMYDGTVADTIITISDIEFNLKKLNNNNFTTEDDFYMLIAGSFEDDNFLLYSEKPQGVLLEDKVITDLTAEERKLVEAGPLPGNSYKVNVKVVKHGTNAPIDNKYENLAFGAYDIDIPDYTNTSDLNNVGTISSQEQILTGSDKPYAESLELIKGFNHTVHLANREPLEGFLITEQAVVTNVTGPHNGVRIIPDGTKLSNTQIRPAGYDWATYYSGLYTTVDPKDFTFYWTGCSCETLLFSSQDVEIIEIHNKDGNVYTHSYGNKVNLEKIDEEERTQHLMWSTPTYSFAPKEGYIIKSLKIDDVQTEIPSDYKYTFGSLVYNPLVRLDNTAHATGERIVNLHKIEIVYDPNGFTIVYEDGGGKDGVSKMPDEEGEYGVKIALSENQYKKIDNVFESWKVYVEDTDGTRVEYKSSDGKQVYLKDKSEIEDILVPNGGKLVLVAQWLNNPKTGDISELLFLGLYISLAIGAGLYVYSRKKVEE